MSEGQITLNMVEDQFKQCHCYQCDLMAPKLAQVEAIAISAENRAIIAEQELASALIDRMIQERDRIFLGESTLPAITNSTLKDVSGSPRPEPKNAPLPLNALRVACGGNREVVGLFLPD